MKYILFFTDRFIQKGIDRLFELKKTDGRKWLPNEDLVQMISGIKVSDYECFFDSIINKDDFNFFEYSQIIISDEGLDEINIKRDNIFFSLFEDSYSLPKNVFIELIFQMLDILINKNNEIKNLGIKILDVNLLLDKKEKIIFKWNLTC